jgi:predicted ATPase with chaperone activity
LQILIKLAPASIRKEGTLYDLADRILFLDEDARVPGEINCLIIRETGVLFT